MLTPTRMDKALNGPMTLDELNQASPAAFRQALGDLYEHSPWIAERAADRRPFADRDALASVLATVVAEATPAEQLALVRAHPDLGGKLARQGALQPASASEQAGLGLDRLSDAEFDQFQSLNQDYRTRFGFPFVIAVKQQTRQTVLAAFARRVTNDRAVELRNALAEIDIIARLRLDMLVG